MERKNAFQKTMVQAIAKQPRPNLQSIQICKAKSEWYVEEAYFFSMEGLYTQKYAKHLTITTTKRQILAKL